MIVQDRYTSTVRQAQETWSGLLESVLDNQQKAFGHSVSPFGLVNPSAAIDQVFDLWTKTLEVQREAAKTLVGVTVTVGETLRTQAQSVGEMVREQTESANRVAREQVDAVKQAAEEQAVRKYADLTKAELQDALDRRDLPKTGNVDELRERLIADDQK